LRAWLRAHQSTCLPALLFRKHNARRAEQVNEVRHDCREPKWQLAKPDPAISEPIRVCYAQGRAPRKVRSKHLDKNATASATSEPNSIGTGSLFL